MDKQLRGGKADAGSKSWAKNWLLEVGKQEGKTSDDSNYLGAGDG